MIQAPPSPGWRLYQALPILLVAGLALVWASRPSVPVLVRGAGLMTSPETRRGFYARGPGQVQAIRTTVGQTVAQGQVGLTLNQVGQAAPGGGTVTPDPQVTQAQLAAVNEQFAVLHQQDQALDAQQQALDRRRVALVTTNRPVHQQLKALESLRKDEVIARYSPLWVGAQDLYLRNQADLSAVEASSAQLRAQRALLEAQSSQLRAQRATLQAAQLSQVVFSPVSGRILDLAVQPGQAVAPGQRLGSIALPQAENDQRAIVLFTTADAARLRLGTKVHLIPQLLSRDSFGGARQRYGSVEGTLEQLSDESVALEDVAAQLGSQADAAHLMASARQRSFGEGGDLTAQLPDRVGAPLVLGVVRLERASTPSGLAWSEGQGPPRPLPSRTPAEVEVELEQRSPLGYVLPFWRWLTGARE